MQFFSDTCASNKLSQHRSRATLMLGKTRLLDAPEHLISDVICRHWCLSLFTLLHTLPEDPAMAAQVALSSVDLLSWSSRISRLSLLPQRWSNDCTPHLPAPPPSSSGGPCPSGHAALPALSTRRFLFYLRPRQCPQAGGDSMLGEHLLPVLCHCEKSGWVPGSLGSWQLLHSLHKDRQDRLLLLIAILMASPVGWLNFAPSIPAKEVLESSWGGV